MRLRLAATRLSRLLRQQADTGLTPTKLAHLATIMREGPMSLGDLAAREQVSAPTVTKVVRGLEEHGLVTRDVDSVDARVTLVRVTEKGRAAIDEIRTRKDLWLTQRLAELPPVLSAKEYGLAPHPS